MKKNLHVIQTQIVDLTVFKRENSLALQQQFEKILEDIILPRLEPVFDDLAGPEEWIALDKLEVNLGRLHPLQSNLWIEKSFQEITSAVRKAVTQSKPHSSPTPRGLQEIILFFLRRGYLPWWAVEIKIEETVQKLIKTNPAKLLSYLQEKQCKKRWVKQFDQKVQKALLKALAVPPPVSFEEWKSLVIIHREHLISENKMTEGTLIELYWESVWEALQPNTLKGKSTFESITRVRLPAQKGNQTTLQTQKANLSEGIYVLLAGIVLVHPFLPAFFEKLGLLKEGIFKDEVARERAVHLLYFVATASQHPEEQETVLLKLLCGMAIETPIIRELNLMEQEKEEANDLLESVIFYWKEMEGTSADELRGSFFVREGKLGQGEMGWALKVEEKSYDILLSKLPWGLSPIKQDWMRQMLWVEWD